MNATSTAYRTAKGNHRHADYNCANALRDIESGDPVVIPAAEVSDWAPCSICTTDAEVQAHTEAKAATKCANSGVTHPQRGRSACRDCGKVGAVNRSTGTLRAH